MTGPATRAQALSAGISDEQLRHRDVVRLSRDTYLPRAMSGNHRARIAAVLLAAPESAVLSHRTAAMLWGLEIPLQAPDDRIHLTARPGAAARNRADRFVHRTRYDPSEVTQLDGLPVTTPARTWRDLAAVVQAPALLAVTDQLLVELSSAAVLAAQLARRPSGRGAARARECLRLGDPRSGSPMESVLRWLIHDAGLPAPDLQLVVNGDDGSFAGQADFAWPEAKVLVEFDGDVHRDRDVFVKDLRRQNRLVAAGWIVLRFSSADVLGRPNEVVAAIRRALKAR